MTELEPIFASIFGTSWPHLPAVMHKHYANRPNTKDLVSVDGLMDVEAAFLIRLFAPLFRLAGALVPYSAQQIPVTVHYRSEPGSATFVFDRIFRFPGRAPYHFRSRMMPAGGDQVIEWMPVGIGWHARYRFDGSRILLEHLVYKARLFGLTLSLPLQLLMGRGHAEEWALSDESFAMSMELRHPWFGKIYAYRGTFTITRVTLDE